MRKTKNFDRYKDDLTNKISLNNEHGIFDKSIYNFGYQHIILLNPCIA